MGYIIGDHITPTLNDIVYWDGTKWALRNGSFITGDVAPIFDTTIIFGPGAKNDNWEDLDGGVGQAILYLEITIAAGENTVARFRPNGETVANFAEDINAAKFDVAGPSTLAYAMVGTDSAGLIEWRYNGAQNVTIRRIGYWPLAPVERTQLYAAQAGTGAYQTLNLGIPNALVIVMFEMVSAGANIYGRCRGEPATSTYGVTYSSPGGAGVGAMMLFKTDGAGQVEVNWNVGVTANIWRLGFLTKLINYGDEAFSVGTNPPAAWTDLDCLMGQAFLYVSQLCTGGAFTNVRYRRNGGPAADVKNDTGLVAASPNINLISYNFVPVDRDGLVEWIGDNADTVTLRRLVASR